MKRCAIEGVNLGGWLLLERWMTPSVFSGSGAEDEYTLSGQPGMKERIDEHRKTFITEEDWQWLSLNNVTHVRLPVGYWVLKGDGPYYNAKKYLDLAFNMAEKYKINILLDLHGLKGSQNGEMHSGRQGLVDWKRYKDIHLKVVESLAIRYKNSPSFWGLEIINEPRVWGNYFALLGYYRKAYKKLRKIVRPGTYIVFQDGFLPPLFSGTLSKRKDYPVAMDTHFYLIFPKLLQRMSATRYDILRKLLYASLVWTTRLNQPIIIGEWSSVLPQSFFDRVHRAKHMKLLRETIVRQRVMYKYATATFYWSYKTEGRGMYHYRSLVEDGVITR
ncbi:cellulase family glycosylhydrolase [Candidatus Saccharibacteria bacterium]|nr:cellulase family glycosylhydrolase [Candidatus Saccharibacteria bacterium]